jgi:hypothetical protein
MEFLKQEEAVGRGRRGPRGPRGGPQREQTPVTKGRALRPGDVKTYPAADIYDPTAFRTFFLEFEDADWETQMTAFKNTDVELIAKVTVDGKVYPDVGVHFRGMSSFMMVGEGRKKSLNLSFDYVKEDQRIGNYRTLEFLNSHSDPSFLRTALASEISRAYIPAPKVNFVEVVINGESWGVYVNAQPFNKDFIRDAYKTTKGARWKVPGSPAGRGGLAYLGDNIEDYRKIYTLKTKEDSKVWKDLIRLCQVLNETPADQLEKALEPLLDIEGALKFLALDNALVNNDGYWIRTSDYSIYQDVGGRFHLIPHDLNETFMRPESPRGQRGRGPRTPNAPEAGAASTPQTPAAPNAPAPRGVELDPLVAASDAAKPLASKLLAVPALRQRYLGYVRDIATEWLDWKKLGPIAERHHAQIAEAVHADTHKLNSTEAFEKSLTDDIAGEAGGPPGGPGGPGGRSTIGLKKFADERRAYLLKP